MDGQGNTLASATYVSFWHFRDEPARLVSFRYQSDTGRGSTTARGCKYRRLIPTLTPYRRLLQERVASRDLREELVAYYR
jgi:hypothetical protein